MNSDVMQMLDALALVFHHLRIGCRGPLLVYIQPNRARVTGIFLLVVLEWIFFGLLRCMWQ